MVVDFEFIVFVVELMCVLIDFDLVLGNELEIVDVVEVVLCGCGYLELLCDGDVVVVCMYFVWLSCVVIVGYFDMVFINGNVFVWFESGVLIGCGVVDMKVGCVVMFIFVVVVI